jgi:leucyl aminopeptidase
MYSSPILKTISSATPIENSGRHLLVLTHPKRGVPVGLAKKVIPARFSTGHPAVSGERGAKLTIHGETTSLVMGLGDLKTFTPQEAAEWGENAAHALIKEKIDSVQVVFPDDLTDRDVLLNFLKGMSLGNFRIEEFKTGKKADRTVLKEIGVSGRGASKLGTKDYSRLAAIVSGIAFAREIVELPAETADPQGIVNRFKSSIDTKRIELEVWDEKKIRAQGMGLIAAVSAGSHAPPRFLVARLGKRPGRKTLFLVGKGVTFDTGGVNLKTVAWRDLLWMKKDMGGAAAVLGAMIALSQLKPNINVVGVTPLTTNSIDSKAIMPGDIFTSYAGKTVEIQNTDAEGRLILADALHFAVLEKASYIVNAATLTGACAVALGIHNTGLFTNNEKFAKAVASAAEVSGEPTWPMPMSPRYGDELKSQLADLSNMGKGRDGGATLGGKFLENFVGETPWVHLDIAGTVDLGEPAAAGAQTHAAGRMVHTFVTLAENLGR